MSPDLPIIDVEFEVIELAFADRDDVATDDGADQDAIDAGRWTFWDDDFPLIAGLAAGLAIAIAFALYWPESG